MSLPEIHGIIYKIVNTTTNMMYIRQTRNILQRKKNGIAYKSKYGIEGRMKTHLFQVKKGCKTFLHTAMRNNPSQFTIECILTCNLLESDQHEKRLISELNTLKPNGYNTQIGGEGFKTMKCKVEYFKTVVIEKIELKPITKYGILNSVRLLVTFDGKTVRIMFNSTPTKNYQTCITESFDFITRVKDTNTIIEDNLTIVEPHILKAQQFNGQIIVKIRITIYKQKKFDLIAVYVRDDKAVKQTDEIKICFGGKTISFNDAYENAIKFCQELVPKDKIIISKELTSRIEVSNKGML